eukprot:435073-Pelagomonas_calceolata.AAC.5
MDVKEPRLPASLHQEGVRSTGNARAQLEMALGREHCGEPVASCACMSLEDASCVIRRCILSVHVFRIRDQPLRGSLLQFCQQKGALSVDQGKAIANALHISVLHARLWPLSSSNMMDEEDAHDAIATFFAQMPCILASLLASSTLLCAPWLTSLRLALKA